MVVQMFVEAHVAAAVNTIPASSDQVGSQGSLVLLHWGDYKYYQAQMQMTSSADADNFISRCR